MSLPKMPLPKMSLPKRIARKILKKVSKKVLVLSTCSCLIASTVIASPFAFFTTSVQAQSRVRYVPPSNLDAPKTSSPGITRSACTPEEKICLIALLPDLHIELNPIPQTISERPTIYFLSPNFEGKASFQIREVQGSQSKYIYGKIFDLKNNAGIVGFKIPNEAPILEVGKSYKFKLTLINGDVDQSKNVFGYIRRILPTPNLVEQLKNNPKPLDRAALFAQEGIWFESVQTLVEAQQTVPKNTEAAEEWISLMKSANLLRVLPYAFVTQIPDIDAVTMP